MNDIDLSPLITSKAWQDDDGNAATSWNPIGKNAGNAFKGIFDGGGYKITGLKIDAPYSHNIGLFGYMSGGLVKNLGIEGLEIGGGDNVGGIAGYADNDSTIENCYLTGTALGDSFVGGIVGLADSAAVENCYLAVAVSGTYYVGGISGYGGNIRNCVAFNSSATGVDNVGRIVGGNGGGLQNNFAFGVLQVRPG